MSEAGENEQAAPGETGAYVDRYWTTKDGLKQHYRDYPGSDDFLPVLCIPGLTRNARDFDQLARSLSPRRRVLSVNLRGRSLSEPTPDSADYRPPTYAADILEFLNQIGVKKVAVVGTSLGGLVTMILAMIEPDRIAGLALNDIGPVIEKAGLERIGSYVGQSRSFPTWMHAARALEESQGAVFPDWKIDDWLAHAKRLMTVQNNGRIGFDYDMRIAEPFDQSGSDTPQDNAPQADLWAGFEALAGKPLLLVRGELSDLLSVETCQEMQRRRPDMEWVTLPRIGHTPTLDEPEARAAIMRFLEKTG